MEITELVKTAHAGAVRARAQAHAPYSRFLVGAAAICDGGEVFYGCNVENASYGGCVCAERVALLKAISEGHRAFTGIVVVTDSPSPASPCALCLQTMAEFFDPGASVWIADLQAVRTVKAFAALLPLPFGPRQLAEASVAK